MSCNCSICLGPLEDPVCTPCGHVYCTACLANHANYSTTEDGITTTCPTCRYPFYIVIPDLTYLPRQYHKYVLPAVRRVFVDTSGTASLKKRLRKAEARIKTLENVQKALSNEQNNAVRKLNQLNITLAEVSQYAQDTESQRADLKIHLEKMRDWGKYWKSKYRELRQEQQDVKELDDTQMKRKNGKLDSFSEETSAEASSSSVIARDYPLAGREVKPIPRRSNRLTSARKHSTLGHGCMLQGDGSKA